MKRLLFVLLVFVSNMVMSQDMSQSVVSRDVYDYGTYIIYIGHLPTGKLLCEVYHNGVIIGTKFQCRQNDLNKKNWKDALIAKAVKNEKAESPEFKKWKRGNK